MRSEEQNVFSRRQISDQNEIKCVFLKSQENTSHLFGMSSKPQAKPFVKWAGGKGHLLSQLRELFPHTLSTRENFTYVEPFVGGGAMLFYMLQNFPNINHVVINDINSDLISCYRLIKDSPQVLIDSLNQLEKRYQNCSAEKKKEMYYEIRKKYNSRDCGNVEQAAYFIFLNHTCFNGLYRVNTHSEFNVPCGRYVKPTICNTDVILADHDLLASKDIIILNGDYKIVRDYIDPKSHVFTYLDPPYLPISVTSYFKQYSSSPFEEKQQEELELFCQELNEMGCSFMLSNSDCKTEDGQSYFENLYAGYNVRRIFARRYINAHTTQREKLTEIVIRNFLENE